MKNKFIQVLNFLRAYKKDLIFINFYSDYEGAHWNDPYSNARQLPSTILDIIVKIVEKYEDDLYQNTSSDSDYHEIKVLIYPFEQKIVLNIFQEEYGGEDSYFEKNLPEDSFILNYMKENDVKKITTKYNGSGDDGHIGDIVIDGKEYPEAKYWGEPGSDVEKVFNEIYIYLVSEYGGWENDNGANGNILIQDGILTIEHEWVTREMVDSGYEIVLTKDNVKDEE
jgi:hypothetical protein